LTAAWPKGRVPLPPYRPLTNAAASFWPDDNRLLLAAGNVFRRADDPDNPAASSGEGGVGKLASGMGSTYLRPKKPSPAGLIGDASCSRNRRASVLPGQGKGSAFAKEQRAGVLALVALKQYSTRSLSLISLSQPVPVLADPLKAYSWVELPGQDCGEAQESTALPRPSEIRRTPAAGWVQSHFQSPDDGPMTAKSWMMDLDGKTETLLPLWPLTLGIVICDTRSQNGGRQKLFVSMGRKARHGLPSNVASMRLPNWMDTDYVEFHHSMLTFIWTAKQTKEVVQVHVTF